MMLRMMLRVCATGMVVVAACGRPALQGGTPRAELIAFYGHGKLFDRHMNEIKTDPTLLAEIQEALLEKVHEAGLVRKDRPRPIVAADSLLATRELTAEEALVVRGGMIRQYLRDAPPDVRAHYEWRNDAIVSAYLNQRGMLREQLRASLSDLLDALYDQNRGEDTAYMDDCRDQGVPIPPDWAERGTAWVQQGTLTQNLLAPRTYAAVWTYADPANQGACIALPRDDGGVGSQAGIICQSATTGAACFWDNIRRGTEPEVSMGWRGQRLVISELKDGSNLNFPCTQCHRGNNVYNISPDDPTWARVLRVLPTTDPTFTTQVHSSSDNQGGRARYIPLTTVPARVGWENTYTPPDPSQPGCAGCHEQPVLLLTPPMPPACASTPEGCYAP